jgi:hypothetical protein
MASSKNKSGNQAGNVPDMSSIVQRKNTLDFAAEQYNSAVNEYNAAVEQYKSENPDVDVEAILSEQKKFLPVLAHLSNRELDKFVTYAKNQGTKMSFHDMENGVLAAGRKDMQDGLTDILDSIKFSSPVCPDCNKKMENRGRSKKKF